MIYPNAIITELSRDAWTAGLKILQGNRLGSTDKKHVDVLAFYMGLTGQEEHIADMGCGFGEVSKILSRKRNGRQAMYWLVNNNRFQMEKCLEWDGPCAYMERDMCDSGIADDRMDIVMFNYSLCHVEPLMALIEAHRIAREGGKLFVYDYERTGGGNALAEKILYARFLTDAKFRAACAATGWHEVEKINPGGNDAIFRSAMNDQAIYDEIFDNLEPVIWTAKK